MEIILGHKGKGAWHLYLVMWKAYPITEASWEHELHLQNAPLILEDYLCRVRAEDQRQRQEQRRREEGLKVVMRSIRPREHWGLKDQCLLGAARGGKWCSAC